MQLYELVFGTTRLLCYVANKLSARGLKVTSSPFQPLINTPMSRTSPSFCGSKIVMNKYGYSKLDFWFLIKTICSVPALEFFLCNFHTRYQALHIIITYNCCIYKEFVRGNCCLPSLLENSTDSIKKQLFTST